MKRRLPVRAQPGLMLYGNGDAGDLAGVSRDFVRGFVASGLLGAVQDRQVVLRLDRRALRLGLQGGSALAAGTYAAGAWQRGQVGQALLSAAAGLAAVATFEHLLREPETKEKNDGQEEA
ncbi:MAG: hypothetical protein ACK5JI_05025 [Azonexus sp.]